MVESELDLVQSEAMMVDFELFMTIPVADWKREMVFYRVVKSPMPPFRKINTSSTKSKCVIVQLSMILIPILSTHISFEQFDFLQDRQIHEAFGTTQEVMHSI